jgi:alpha-beta hydrolase superfamily lysophospholipase
MRTEQRQRRFSLSRLQAILAIFVALSFSAQAVCVAKTHATIGQGVAYEEDGVVGEQLKLPIYHWWQPGNVPRGVVLAVHGVVMHGRSYDTLGRMLASQGFDVYAMDLRGYGRSVADDHRYCTSVEDCKHRIDYDKSFEDMIRLARTLRELHPSAPIFAVGESLGGGMVIRLAAKNADLVDGLILSAPAIKHHNFIDPYMVADGALAIAHPGAQLDVMPFVRKFASDDPRIIAEKESDPLLRRTLSAYELMLSSNAVRKTVKYIGEVPAETPVLVIQGSADRCIKANAVMLLLSNLRSSDQTVKWFHERGHILLETDYVKPDTMDAVVVWLNSHVDSPMMQARRSRLPDVVVEPKSTNAEALSGLNLNLGNLEMVGVR